ncbi:MAG: AI-2E family transporter [Hyphomicrobiales bacterium]
MPAEPALRDSKSKQTKPLPFREPIDFARAVRMTAGAIAVIALAFALWYAQTAILLTFAGILLAIVLYGASRELAKFTDLPRMLMLTLVTVAIIAGLALAAWTAGPTLVRQAAQLAQSIAAGAIALTTRIEAAADRTAFLENIDLVQLLGNFMSQWGIATGATSVAVSIFGLFSAGLIVVFFGVYLAADPHTYVNLAARLVPEDKRQTALDLMYETGDLLRRWLIGQSITMSVIGGFTYIGLLILGVPIAFVLAVFAGFACFLPYLGPIIGAIPIILVAGGQSFNLALWALGLYCCVQFLESYLLTPLIQARAVSMPPAVVILNQLIFGAVFGLLGLALATPLAAAATVPLRHVFSISEDDAQNTSKS